MRMTSWKNKCKHLSEEMFFFCSNSYVCRLLSICLMLHCERKKLLKWVLCDKIVKIKIGKTKRNEKKSWFQCSLENCWFCLLPDQLTQTQGLDTHKKKMVHYFGARPKKNSNIDNLFQLPKKIINGCWSSLF